MQAITEEASVWVSAHFSCLAPFAMLGLSVATALGTDQNAAASLGRAAVYM